MAKITNFITLYRLSNTEQETIFPLQKTILFIPAGLVVLTTRLSPTTSTVIFPTVIMAEHVEFDTGTMMTIPPCSASKPSITLSNPCGYLRWFHSRTFTILKLCMHCLIPIMCGWIAGVSWICGIFLNFSFKSQLKGSLPATSKSPPAPHHPTDSGAIPTISKYK